MFFEVLNLSEQVDDFCLGCSFNYKILDNLEKFNSDDEDIYYSIY